MKLKSALALLMSLCLVLALFAGCAKTETAAPAAEEAAAEETAVEEPAPAEEPVAEAEAPAAEAAPAEAPAEEAAPAEAPAEEPAPAEASGEKDITVPDAMPTGSILTYPIGDGSQTITGWIDFETQAWLESTNDMPILPYVVEATGVNVQFTEVSKAQTSEQFQLMIAAGDYEDLLRVDGYYSGGAAQAYEDEVILDLAEDMPEYAPDWWALYEQYNAVTDQGIWTTAADGSKLLLSFNPCNSADYGSGGLLIRQDWLDEIGWSVDDMSTLDGFTNGLKALAEAGYAEGDVYHMEGGGIVNNFKAFDTTFPDMTAALASMYIFVQDDGTVQSGYISDGYREYIEWFRDMIASGVFSESFYTTHLAMNETMSLVGRGGTACFQGVTDFPSMIVDYCDENNQGMVLAALPTITPNDGINNWGEAKGHFQGDTGFNLSTDCQDVELVLGYLNYFFTGDGALMANYGIEGVSFEYNEDGQPEYTDAVLNNPDIPYVSSAVSYYTASYGPSFVVANRLYYTYDESTLDTISAWTASYDSSKRTYPSNCKLTTEEQSGITNQMNDIMAYSQEAILKFIAGSEELNDETWEAYKEATFGFGMQDCLDAYQLALDEYNQGLR